MDLSNVKWWLSKQGKGKTKCGKTFQKYRVYMHYCGQGVNFQYNGSVYGYEAGKPENIERAVWCILRDYFAYKDNPDLYSFCLNWGYEPTSKEGKLAFRECESTYNKLNILFTDIEINELWEKLDKLGF